MSTIKTGYWIRARNGKVTDVWDYKPSDEKIVNEAGWREAIEIFPDLVPNREIITTHVIDIDKSPAEIVWSKRELTIDERKDGLKGQVKATYQAVVQNELRKELDEFPETQYDPQVVAAAQATYESAMIAINALATHEDVDNFGA